ncbi:hypothetical protein SPBRAN_239 [uncultured Candidatus Thioglobus sp.]|nr:hypothetical protein SPBRAN_239 [uncultured Candidatus Thioglobus sp.]
MHQISSFNSTIPSGTKYVIDVDGLSEKIEVAGETVDALPVRQVYYLVRGRQKDAVKVCLVHGSFFQTITTEDLISSAFHEALGVLGSDGDPIFSEEEKQKISTAMSNQSSFSKTRRVESASVSLRFRIMTEAVTEANILKFYPEIKDNTINLVLPLHGKGVGERERETNLILEALEFCDIPEYKSIAEHSFLLKHPLNGYFWVLQYPICKN